MVSELRSKVKSTIDLTESGSKINILEVIIKQLCRLIDSGKKPGFVPKKGKPCVILVTGLQGSGKTLSIIKFAVHHQRRGYNTSLVCADTRKAKAFDRLKLIVQETKIPCYGSYTESDPVKIAVQGVEKFRQENSDLIIMDVGGTHKSEDVFWSELCRIEKATKPELIILVVDAGGSRFAFDQAQAFIRKVSVGSVIVTKMDDHPNGGGTLNALAAARLPVIILGTNPRA